MVRWFAWFALLLAPGLARAADEWPVPRGPAREPAPHVYSAKNPPKIPQNYLDDHPAVILYSGTSHLVEADGMVETITHEITRFNGRKGIDSLGEYRGIYFDPSYQKLTLNEARIHKKDGRVVQVLPRHVQLRDTGTDFQVYDAEKQLVISFPNLEVGDAYEVKWTVRGKNAEFSDHFFVRYSFGHDTYPTVRDELHVVTPPGKKLKHAAVNGTVALKEADLKDGRRHWRWRVENRAGLPREEDRPSVEELRLQVQCSTFGSWEEVARWKKELRKDCWECSPSVHKIVQEVTAGLKTPQEKARALTQWVRSNIRYLSRGPNGRGYTPHQPKQVLEHLFGDCKDQTQLLAVMLRDIGLAPYLVTLGTVGDGQVLPDVPSPWGTHALLMVPIEKKNHWIDTTLTMAPWDFLPRGDRDRQAYLTRENEVLLLRTPSATWNDQRFEQTTVVQVQPDGSAQCFRSGTYHGHAALNRRDQWIETPVGERRRKMANEVQDSMPRARLQILNLDEKNLIDFEKPVRASWSFESPRHFSGSADLEGSFTDSPVWTNLLAYNLDADRTLPMELDTPFESLHLYVIQLAPTHRFGDLPSDRDVKSPWGSFRLTVTQDEKDPRHVELVLHTKLEKVRVEPNQFAEFQRFHEDVTKYYRVWLSLKATTDPHDAPKLETLLALSPGRDASAARILAKLHLDNGRPGEARRVLENATLVHWNDPALWDLRITAAANLAEEERLYGQMVRYFPKETKYALALGRVRVQRGDHGGAQSVLDKLTAAGKPEAQAEALYQLARSHLREQRAKEALDLFEKARGIHEGAVNSAAALQFLARTQQTLGNALHAMAAYRQALELEPDSQETLLPLVRLELAAGLKEEALGHLRRYTLAVQDDVAGLVRASTLHYEMGRLEEAWELAQRARQRGFHAEGQRLLGLLHLAKQEHAQALFHLERADPDPEVLAGLLRCRLLLGELQAAQRHLEVVRQMKETPEPLVNVVQQVEQAFKRANDLLEKARKQTKQENPAAWWRAAQACACAEFLQSQNGKREWVQALVDKALADKVELGPALALRAQLALDRGQLRQAQTDANKALMARPLEPLAFLVRGRVRLERGENGPALEDLRQAYALCPAEDATLLHWLAQAQWANGLREEALASQRRARAMRPEDRLIGEALVRMQREAMKPG